MKKIPLPIADINLIISLTKFHSQLFNEDCNNMLAYLLKKKS
jgi:hypothetical protein